MTNLYLRLRKLTNVFFLAVSLLPFTSQAQTLLSPGGIAFTSYNTSSVAGTGGKFSFVLLTNIYVGTTISFTDRGYTGAGWQAPGSTESTITWQSGTTLGIGTEVYIEGLTAYTYDPHTTVSTVNGSVSLTEGTSPNGLFLSDEGDQIIAFQKGGGSITGTDANIIAGINYFYTPGTTTAGWNLDAAAGPNASKMPPGLAGGTSAFYTGPVTGSTLAQSGKFNCTGVPTPVATNIRTAIMTMSNWTLSTSPVGSPSACTFVLYAPVFTIHPPNRSICAGKNTTFPITATTASSYQWQVNNGSGFSPLSDGGPYSNVNTSTLSITGATTAMNGYQYRCVATNTAGFTTSNPATLTVIAVNASIAPSPACYNESNGSAVIIPTGGLSPYSYSWLPPVVSSGNTATDLAAGNYSVTITDNIGCQTTKPFTITQPAAPLSGTAIVSNAKCFGKSDGAINLTPSGGTPPYTYDWGGGITTEDRTGVQAGAYSVTITDNNGCTYTVNAVVTQPPGLSGSITTLTNVACFGGNTGAIDLTPSGGTPPYTYDWGGGITTQDRTGLTVGPYSVTITDDNGCIYIVSATVNQPPPLSGTASVTNVACFGGNTGAIDLTPSGGTSPYTYDWGDGITTQDRTDLPAGAYSVIITDNNGCTYTVNATVTQPPALSGTTSVTNVSCFGGSNGSIDLTPSGGTSPYTYDWGGGITTQDRTALPAGDYSVIITDNNGCTYTVNAAVTQPAAALSGIASVTDVSCFGESNGTINLSASGGTPPYTYNWSDGVTTEDRTGLTVGPYSVTITDNKGCTYTVNATVTQPPPLSGTASVTNVACFGGNTGAIDLTPSGGTPPYTYNWSDGVTTEDRTGLTVGPYSVTITDNKGCTYTVNATVTQPSALSGTTSVTNVACFGESTGAIDLTPAGGTSPYTYDWGSGITTQDRTALPAGDYSVTITDNNGCTYTVTAAVTQPPAALSGTTSVTNVSCFGESNGAIDLTPSGGTPPYTYDWGGGVTTQDRTGLTVGPYSVIITDNNGCTYTVNTTVTQPPALSGTASVTNVACFGESNGAIDLSPAGGTPPYTYDWGGGITTQDRTGLTVGPYSVIITDNNGCTYTVNATVTQPPALSGTSSVTNVSCFGESTGAIDLIPSGGTPPYTYDWGDGITTQDRTDLPAGAYSVIITDNNGCTYTVNATVTQPPALSGTTSVTNVSCFGGSNGSIDLTPSGGTSPYTYDWGSGITTQDRTALPAGDYSVIITDNKGCTYTVNAAVTQPAAALSGIASVTDVSCFGESNGTINLSASGGTPPYTYNWSDGVTTEDRTGLTVGPYSVIITDNNGCTYTVNATVTQPSAALSGITSVTNLACFGASDGAIDLTPAGGTPPYTYDWGSGITTQNRTGLAAGDYSVTITDNNGCTQTVNATVTQPAAALSGTASTTPVSCFGGSNGTIDLSPSGGTLPYTYNWADGVTTQDRTGLAAGDYSVIITDGNGCAYTVHATITQPAALSGTIAVTQVSCFGENTGAIDLTPSGGTLPYTYDWADGATTQDRTDLPAGAYSVIITDNNGCTYTVHATVTQPAAALSGTTSVTNVACFGESSGAIDLTPSGGTSPYTYDWSDGVTTQDRTDLPAGAYSVIITDNNGCTYTVHATVTQPPAALSGTASTTNVSCFGGSDGTIDLTASGGTSPYTYDWGSGVTTQDRASLPAGDYSVIITDDNGCIYTVHATIAQPAVISGTTVLTNVACFGESTGAINLTPSGGTLPYTYNWADGATTQNRTGLAAGDYSVVITDNNGCTHTVHATITQPAAALSGATTVTNVSCFGESNGAIALTPAGGTLPYTYNWADGAITKDRTGLAAGDYSVTITDDNGCTITQLITVNTTPDVTPAVPDVANLPTITRFCQVLHDEIPVPTASDNCNGRITATTTDPLDYTETGTYSITWRYNDGNDNTSSQTQTIIVEESPFNQVTLDDAIFTYNGSVQSIAVSNLPTGIAADYSIAPATGSDNGAINAGTYTVTAILTPAAGAGGCEPVTLTATITINKAPQSITFDAIPVKNLEADSDFQLDATASSGLDVYYTYTFSAAQPPATLTPGGFADMLTSGDVLITAHQDGNDNWLPAVSVEQSLTIKSSNAAISAITVGNRTYANPSREIYHLLECGNTPDAVDITIATETNAEVSPSHEFTIQTPAPGIYTRDVTVTSQDGSVTQTYTVVIERRLDFFGIITRKFGSLLFVNNNPQTNGGYQFVTYEWYRNGQLAGTGQYYSGDNNQLNPTAEYYVKMTTADGDVLQTCIAQITLESTNAARSYPNPAQAGGTITVEVDFPAEELEQMQISICSPTGNLLTTQRSTTPVTQVQLPGSMADATYIVIIKTPNFKKTLTVMVLK